MAAYTAGAATGLANIARVHSNANNVAEAFGEIDNSSARAHDYHIQMTLPIHASATAGTYDVYVVESNDGTLWTDNIDPGATGDVAAKLSDAKLAVVASTIYNATTRTDAEIHFKVGDVLGVPVPAYIGFVVDNNSGQTIPATGAAGESQSLTF